METMQVRLTESQIGGIDKLVETGIYASRGEAVRDAVRRLELMVALMDLQRMVKEKGITKKELLEELNNVGDELYERKFKSA
ncbi:MAG: hypothetical protein MSIBF_03560 [Candidatus Altiarchaeales archaeon IMC4]|nr:MAG: hypothetical protein MSIBF_03560 [Candidatus Altiarchaeales archaeon IMC4]